MSVLAIGAFALIACDGLESDAPSLSSESSGLTLSLSQSVTAGGGFSCAIVGGGRVRCWGYNGFGQLGNGTTTGSATPVLTTNITNAVAIAGGANHACALLSTGHVRCWGANYNGQLGNGSMAHSSEPVAVTGITAAVQITSGANHSCAILSDSTARCWGWNEYRQLGNQGSTANSTLPVTVQAPGASPLTGITSIAAGSFHTCASLSSGGARCWGSNSSGQLGTGTFFIVPGIASVALASGDLASRVSVGGSQSCAVLTSGQARCWGRNANVSVRWTAPGGAVLMAAGSCGSRGAQVAAA
ncbi:MAG: hypothetical protein K8M05_23240 [Deltaproteobacteria bacterium]|nr:hypothetical protein [Kofleriaceae bacterium]